MTFSSPPPTPARQTRARPWPVVIIVAVLLLAVAVGLVAANFLLTNRSAGAAVGGAASYVPETATMYGEVRLDPSATQDAALRDILGRFPAIDGLDLDRPLADQLAEMIDEGLAAEGSELTWSADVAPWTDGRLAFAVLDLPHAFTDPTADPTGAGLPSFLLLLGVTDPDAARDAVARILDESGAPEMPTTEHLGVTIHGADEGAYAVTDDQLIVGMSADDIATALDTAAGDATMANREELLAHVEALPSDWLAFGTFDMSDALVATMNAAAESRDPSVEMLARLLEHQPMVGAFSVSAVDEGLALDVAAPVATGPFAMANAERSFAAEVPGTALYYAEGGGDMGAALSEVIAALKQAASADPATADAITTAEGALGADLEELVGWIGEGAVAIGWDGAEPYGGLVLEVTDRGDAERRLDQLATFAGLAAMDPSTGITVDEADVAGTTVVTIAWSDPAAAEAAPIPFTGVSLQYALTDDRALVGIGERFVPSVLELDPAESLASEPRYADAVAALGGPSVAGVTWMDIAGIVEAAQVALDSIGVPMGATDEVLEWTEPLDRLVTVARVDGDALIQRSVLMIR